MHIENYIIDQVDIDNFNNACKQLRETLETIRYYVPSAHYYVTPNEIHLMVGYGDSTVERNASEKRVDGFVIPHMDCGDYKCRTCGAEETQEHKIEKPLGYFTF